MSTGERAIGRAGRSPREPTPEAGLVELCLRGDGRGVLPSGRPSRIHGGQPRRAGCWETGRGQGPGPGRLPAGVPNARPLPGTQQPQDLDLPDHGEPVQESPADVAPPPSRSRAPDRGPAARRGALVRSTAAGDAVPAGRAPRTGAARAGALLGFVRSPLGTGAARGGGAHLRGDRGGARRARRHGEEPALARPRRPSAARSPGCSTEATRDAARGPPPALGVARRRARRPLRPRGLRATSPCARPARAAEELRAVSGLLAELPELSTRPTRLRADGATSSTSRSGARRPGLARSSAGCRGAAADLAEPRDRGLARDGGARVLARSTGPVGPTTGRSPGAAAGWRAAPASGTEGNPFFPSAEVALPRERPGALVPEAVLAQREERTRLPRDGGGPRRLGGGR